MTAQTAPTVAIPPENSHNSSNARRSVDRELLTALFKLIEVAEPTLLSCRDALAASGDHVPELRAIQATLDHMGELKANPL